ncbi:MAG: hypothetical protein SF053_05960 [Bacteroidia bacterium]|nr:hypothetical protein [Bacteroidia bacterium]
MHTLSGIIIGVGLALAACQPSLPASSVSPESHIPQGFDTVMYADFNGDGTGDTVRTVTYGGKKGLVFTHGRTGDTWVAGAGKYFGAAGDDFGWVDHAHIVTPSEVEETTFYENGDVAGSRKVTLPNPGIFTGETEGGGGIIVWRKDKYEWIHQAD